ncbi:hypothetical protein [Rhodococcus sp. MEB064]|uniref:hypothetical protein n=1 Tax=Rhodococcus sp. MEB064 TaxID=1587522 RepID=UPI0012E07A76|nr:hypothetical protein [Rhodococcus sp. MEB064]
MEFKVDDRLIRQRQGVGQRLFNAPALYFREIRVNAGALQISVGSCSYFDIATSLIRLENETFRGLRLRKERPQPYRDRALYPTDSSRWTGDPFSVAASVALILGKEGDEELLLHRRSFETVTYGGMQAVIPYFGMMPIDPPRGSMQGLDIDYVAVVNIIKEYCEELFSYDELIDHNSHNIVDPDWIYNIREAADLKSWLVDGRAELSCLGFGFDALNGSATVSYSLWIKDEQLVRGVRRKFNGNWEVDSAKGASMRLYPLRSAELAGLLLDRDLTYGSAFTVSRVLELLEHQSGQL